MSSDTVVKDHPAGLPPLWAHRGLCNGRTDLFFAPPGERSGRRLRREALAVSYCAQCPVRADCLAAGRQNREHGIWGGENDEERAAAGYPPRSGQRRVLAVVRNTRGS